MKIILLTTASVIATLLAACSSTEPVVITPPTNEGRINPDEECFIEQLQLGKTDQEAREACGITILN